MKSFIPDYFETDYSSYIPVPILLLHLAQLVEKIPMRGKFRYRVEYI